MPQQREGGKQPSSGRESHVLPFEGSSAELCSYRLHDASMGVVLCCKAGGAGASEREGVATQRPQTRTGGEGSAGRLFMTQKPSCSDSREYRYSISPWAPGTRASGYSWAVLGHMLVDLFRFSGTIFAYSTISCVLPGLCSMHAPVVPSGI